MSDLFEEVVIKLANAKEPVCVTAAAGCGKTEAIVSAVERSFGKQLILTHTNAGVSALRSRLRKKTVPEEKFRVETIASWLLKFAIAYPSMSGFANPRPQGGDWEKVYPAAKDLFVRPFIRDILQASYQGVFVDEYQDCTQQQHAVIMKMCEYLPVRVLGDPLQGIFGFQDDPLVNWQTDVVNMHFSPLPDLISPYRWQKADANPKLGEQLSMIREKLLADHKIDLTNIPEIIWQQWTQDEEVSICRRIAATESGTIAGIHLWPLDAQNAARGMAGEFQFIEEMDCKDLMKVAREIDERREQNDNPTVVSSVKNFILGGCGNRNPFNNPKFLENEFNRLVLGDLSIISEVIGAIIQDSTMQVYRRELFAEMKRAAQEFASGKYALFEQAAYAARYKTRVIGRRPENRIISRTLLIKGLEFDHAIVLNADKLKNWENFYVAITRGSQSLTVLSSSPIIRYPCPS